MKNIVIINHMAVIICDIAIIIVNDIAIINDSVIIE